MASETQETQEQNDEALNLGEDYMTGDEDMDPDEENPVEEADSIVSTSVNRGRGNNRRKKSKCWKSFKVLGTYPDGKKDVQCRHCEHIYCLDLRSGTNTMLRHMRVCSMTPGCGNRKLDMMVFREMIAVAIIEHNLPYSFVEYRRIREAFVYANSSIEFWCRNTAVADCLRIFEKEKRKLRESLSDIPGRFCLTTDLWRAITVEGYMCLTAHYIDRGFNLKAKILSFCVFPPPHTGAAIASKVMEILKEWGLEKRVFTITVDNASSNDNMQGVLKRQMRKNLVCNGEFFHIRCVAHILNLIVQSGLTVIEEALEKIRDSVKFVKASESREKSFQDCVEVVGIREDIAKAGLVSDVTTRAEYVSNPSEEEWRRAESICELLCPFAEMTKMISGSTYPSANLYFMQVYIIESWLKTNEFSYDEVIQEMVGSMKEKFDKYWEEYSDILAIAAVLDPRLKFKCLEYCFHSLDPTTSKSRVDNVRKKMKKFFSVYSKNTNGTGEESSERNTNILPGYEGFYAFFSQATGGNAMSSLDKYLEESVLDMVAFPNFDVIGYWKDNANRFKDLAKMACDVLSIPITTVASESSFSIGSRVLNKYRSSLLPSNVQALICARNWLRGFEEIDDEFEFSKFEEDKNQGEED
ncbi:unnamed protein product [Microthlaspi erraticum]|uniref:BED-type domain-containing protein n=1 Tax=Microthlaspi erraticum TaxID=1685480 RepID=A0A6D2IVB8_9BRAS|nr:unnamed protein product [Microthlaspi erraticum]